jgi:subtilisin family serine protease
MALGLLVLAMLAIGASGSGSSARAAAPANLDTQSAQAASKIEAKVLADTANGKSAQFIVLMSEQANLTSAYSMKDQDARGWYVYNTLRDTAARTQAPLRARLDALGVQYKARWVANALLVTGDRALVEELAARPDVRNIEANRPMYLIEPMRASTDKSSAPRSPHAGIEWGVANVKAPEVWAMGYTGQGIVVAGADTGIHWTHQALKSHYRGWNGVTADHNYNWHDAIDEEDDPIDPCGPASPEPCDGHNHGTHTVGTIVGDDGMGNQIGVAPGAKWMGCRNMVSLGVGFGAVFDTYAECFEFFLAPTKLDGTMPDATKRPHVINNSWGCPEGCAPNTLKAIIESTQASGILVEASAGNDGPACSTVDVPPAIYEASFSTGAIDIDNLLADFSSRGPVAADGSLRLKPNISAPGVDNRSAIMESDDAYDTFSGTSMAGPHVVGVVALLWSARPELVRQITETKTLLQMSANPDVAVNEIEALQACGGTTPEDIPNNFFGYGRVDALAAVEMAQGVETTPTPAATHTPGTPTVTPTVCPIQFADVDSDDTFYPYVRCLACRHIVGGYPCGGTNPDTDEPEPCNGNQPYYRPNSNVTRGQISKMVAESFGYSADPGDQVYQDVEPGDPFYVWINRLTSHDVMNGYPCGGPGEPCVDGNRPYFRPASYATRGQLSKIVANAAAFHEFHNNQVFQDVPGTHPFYMYIARLASRLLVSGYPCGGINPDTGEKEPCEVGNKPYFRPASNVTRGQTAKIVANAAFPGCNTP